MIIPIIAAASAYICGWYVFSRLALPKTARNVLAFHNVVKHAGPSITGVNPLLFRRMIAYLAASGYRGRRCGECVEAADLAITFDDGLVDLFDNAIPYLEEHDFGATIFVVSEFVGKQSLWDYQKRLHLDWSQLRQLADRGYEIASHSATHRDLRGLSEKILDHEITDSKKMLEDKLGVEIKHIAYPFGRFDKRVIEAVQRAGYAEGFALTEGAGPFARARICLYRYDSPFSLGLKLNGFWLESCKDYINNYLAGGTIVLNKYFRRENEALPI